MLLRYKRGIVYSVTSALKRSCVHHVGEAVKWQVSRLVSGGYSYSFLESAFISVLEICPVTVQADASLKSDEGCQKRVALFYFDALSNNIKAVAKDLGV